MKKLLFGALLGATSLTFASFDLLLVADRDTATLGYSRIHRYDPKTGVYLGAIPFSSRTDPIRMSASFAKGRVYATDGNGIFSIDYSTGQVDPFMTGLQATDLAVSADGTKLYAANGTNIIFEFNTSNLSTSRFIGIGSGTWHRLATDRSGNLVLVDNTAQIAQLVSSTTLAPIGASAAFTSGLAAMGQFALRTNPPASTSTFRGAQSTNPSTACGLVSNATGITTAPSTGVLYPGSFTTITGVASSHFGNYFVGTDGTTPSVMRVAEQYPSDARGFTFTARDVITPGEVAIVLAPEPAAWIVVALGLVALLRKRRT